MKTKKSLVLAFFICLALIVTSLPFMTSCAKPAQQPKPEWPKAQVWSGVSSGATSTIMAIALAELITKELGIRVAVQPSASATEGLTRTINRDSDLCITTTYDLYQAYRGLDVFEGKEKGLVRALVGQYVSLSHIVAKKDIKKFEDIKGKRVMIKAPAAQAHDILTKACLDAYGMKYDDFIAMPRLGDKEIVAAMKDGTADVAFFPGHPPAPFFVELATDIDVNFIPIDENKAKAICQRLPFYTYQSIPAGTYRGQDKDVMCVGFTMTMAVRKDFPEDLAYEVVKILFDNLKELGNVHPVYKKLDLKIATDYQGGPYHSGAVTYYKKRGIWTPELEAMQQRTLAELGQQK